MKPKATVDAITQAVCQMKFISVSEISQRCRKESLVYPRFLICYFSWYWTDTPLKNIALELGLNSHATTYNGRNRIIEQLEPKVNNKIAQEDVRMLEQYLTENYEKVIRKEIKSPRHRYADKL